MPKVTLTRRQADRERWRKNLKHLKGGNTNEEMAKIMGAKRGQTFAARMERPEPLTMGEMSSLCEHFKYDRAKFVCGNLNEGEGFK